jgi:hypothetical protein
MLVLPPLSEDLTPPYLNSIGPKAIPGHELTNFKDIGSDNSIVYIKVQFVKSFSFRGKEGEGAGIGGPFPLAHFRGYLNPIEIPDYPDG